MQGEGTYFEAGAEIWGFFSCNGLGECGTVSLRREAPKAVGWLVQSVEVRVRELEAALTPLGENKVASFPKPTSDPPLLHFPEPPLMASEKPLLAPDTTLVLLNTPSLSGDSHPGKPSLSSVAFKFNPSPPFIEQTSSNASDINTTLTVLQHKTRKKEREYMILKNHYSTVER